MRQPHFTHLREQAERCRRLARGCTDSDLCDHLPGLADEYDARAAALENDEAVDRAVEGDNSALIWLIGRLRPIPYK